MGNSYITITSESNPQHPIIKALNLKGIGNAQVWYAPRLSTYSGWLLASCNKQPFPLGSGWLGYTKSEAVDRIASLKVEGDKLIF